jgi:hypothetical protein
MRKWVRSEQDGLGVLAVADDIQIVPGEATPRFHHRARVTALFRPIDPPRLPKTLGPNRTSRFFRLWQLDFLSRFHTLFFVSLHSLNYLSWRSCRAFPIERVRMR